MRLTNARYVIAIAEQRNLSKAAEELFVSQSTLSHALNRIEEELGTRLFDRTQLPLQVTDAGEVYIKNAKQILLLEDNTKKEIQEIIDSERGTITVGLTSLAQRCCLPAVLPGLLKSYPHIQLSLKTGTLSQLEDMLDHDLIDFAIMVKADSNKYHYLPLLDYTLVLAAPARKPLGGKMGLPSITPLELLPEIPFSCLSEETFITMTEGQQLYDIAMGLFNLYNFIPRIALKCSSLETIHDIIANGVGISLIPDLVIRRLPAFPSVQYYRIKDENLKRTLSLTYKRGKYLPKIARQFTHIS